MGFLDFRAFFQKRSRHETVTREGEERERERERERRAEGRAAPLLARLPSTVRYAACSPLGPRRRDLSRPFTRLGPLRALIA